MSQLSQVKTANSERLFESAKDVMPGGVTANIKFFPPYPLYMDRGDGAYLRDADGNDYVDYMLSYGALMLGHGHPAIKETLYSQIENSGTWVFGAPHELEIQFANKIKHYFSGMDLLRYTNSGTEATLLALRLAEAYTGKHKMAKFEGHYHGGYNQVLLSLDPDSAERGNHEKPNAVPSSKGINGSQIQETVVLPFNDSSAFDILKEHANEIGAVLIEPVQGGFIPAERWFMSELRDLTEERDIVLIVDEVKTGFRINLGGAQSYYGIQPDLTTLGKVIGGGFPLGVVGGKKDILMESSPIKEGSSEKLKSRDVLFHSGTYNGHPLILAAGLKTIDILENELDNVLIKTDLLKSELEQLFLNKGIPMQAIGIGSLFNVVMSEQRILNYRDYDEADFDMRKKIDYQLLYNGVYSKPLSRYSMSTRHGEKEIERTINAYEEALNNV